MPEPTLSRGQLFWFDLTQGIPTALGVLRRHLTRRQVAKVMVRVAWRETFSDPFRDLPPRDQSQAERLSRAQLRPALLLERTLREDLGLAPEAVHAILLDVVSETGARFIASNVPFPTRAEWTALPAEEQSSLRARTLGRFFNMTPRLIDDPGAFLAFDVTSCHFASLAAELGCPQLATVFCHADRVLFDDPERSPLRLERGETLATGGQRCDFRFHFRDQQPQLPEG